MKIVCPICKQKQELNFKLLFRERCNSCKEKYYLHYSKPIKLFRFLMQSFIITIIGIYISITNYPKLLSLPLFFISFMIIEILCLLSLKEQCE